jgi:hypothetical protein
VAVAHAYAAASGDLPEASSAIAKLALAEAVIVLDEELVCLHRPAPDGGPALFTDLRQHSSTKVFDLKDPAHTLKIAADLPADCTRWLKLVRHPYLAEGRAAGPLRILWMPATLVVALTPPATRGTLRAYLNIKGTAGGQVVYDVVYEDTAKQRWHRVAIEHSIKGLGTRLVVDGSGFALAGADGKVLRTVPTAEVRPGAPRRRRRR